MFAVWKLVLLRASTSERRERPRAWASSRGVWMAAMASRCGFSAEGRGIRWRPHPCRSGKTRRPSRPPFERAAFADLYHSTWMRPPSNPRPSRAEAAPRRHRRHPHSARTRPRSRPLSPLRRRRPQQHQLPHRKHLRPLVAPSFNDPTTTPPTCSRAASSFPTAITTSPTLPT